jgi:hypothetical protein
MTWAVQANLIILMLNETFPERDWGLCVVHIFQLCLSVSSEVRVIGHKR